jgi:tripartite-type tricarboxylate transporter receptor subunit TctC
MKLAVAGSGLLAAGLAMAFAAPAWAQQKDYPNRPIRYIVPYSPGGSTTWTSRLVGQRLTEAWGEQVIIDNRPGASTIIGTEMAVKSKPDGYTLVYIGSALCANQTLMKTPYDAIRDIAPIATVSSYENLFVVHPSLPVKSVKEFVALAKKRPGELNYATSSHGGSTHLAASLFNLVAKIKTTQIPYKGGGPAVIDLLGGQVQFFFSVPVNVVTHVKGKRLRALAITGDQRIGTLPDVPSFAEAGMPEVSLATWQGLGAPAGTPKEIIDRIAAEVSKLVAAPDTKDKLAAQGFEPYFNGPEKTAALVKQDIERFAKIIKEAGIKTEH